MRALRLYGPCGNAGDGCPDHAETGVSLTAGLGIDCNVHAIAGMESFIPDNSPLELAKRRFVKALQRDSRAWGIAHSNVRDLETMRQNGSVGGRTPQHVEAAEAGGPVVPQRQFAFVDKPFKICGTSNQGAHGKSPNKGLLIKRPLTTFNRQCGTNQWRHNATRPGEYTRPSH